LVKRTDRQPIFIYELEEFNCYRTDPESTPFAWLSQQKRK
jgi:hypothetical protein